MAKTAITIVVSLVCLMLPLHQDATQQPPLLTFNDLKRDEVAGPFRIEGYVFETYKCPPCPPGAMCKPCIGDHAVITDNLDKKDPTLI
jgi:hypothetical protein